MARTSNDAPANTNRTEDLIVDSLNRLISANGRSRPGQVLDAGCGVRCALAFSPDDIVTGVDISAELLERNQRLDHRIVSDLGAAKLPRSRFDTIVCWDVLEHLADPVPALDNLERSLAPEGILVVKAPNLSSPKGLVTKYTPHRFHRWVYQRFQVASSDYSPFPTAFDRSITSRGLESWASRRGLTLRWSAFWEAEIQIRLRSRLHLEGLPWSLAQKVARIASLGRLRLQETEFVLVFEKTST